MAIPLRIVNRLALGRSVAAEVPASRDGYRAWVHITPVADTGEPVTQVVPGIEPMLPNSAVDSPVRFDVRHVELAGSYLRDGYDLDRAWQDPHTVDEHVQASDLSGLDDVLGTWLADASQLTIPADASYPALPRKPRRLDHPAG